MEGGKGILKEREVMRDRKSRKRGGMGGGKARGGRKEIEEGWEKRGGREAIVEESGRREGREAEVEVSKRR